MKTKLHSTFCILHSASAALAAFALFTTTPRAPAQSQWGNALSFDGTSQYVEFTRPVSNDFTIEFWFQSSDLGGGTNQWWAGLGLVDGDVRGVTNDFGVSLGQGSVLFGTGGSSDYTIASPVVVNGQWHHVAATRQEATGTMQLYVNGQLVASGTNSPNVSLTAPSTLQVGHIASGGGFFQGQIDEVRIWNVARTAAQIQDGMCHPLSGTEPNLVGYWKFDELSGDTAHDSTAYARNGTLVNTPVWTNSTIPPFLNLSVGLPSVYEYNDPTSVVWGDFNNDGRLDILFGGLVPVALPVPPLWQNTGSGFTNVTGTAGMKGVFMGASVTFADFDGDGHLDLLLVGSTNYLDLYHSTIADLWWNTGNSTFAKTNAPFTACYDAQAVWGDLDNDGRLDLLLVGGVENGGTHIEAWRNNGDGTFSNMNVGLPTLPVMQARVALGDYNNDGRLDILLSGMTFDDSSPYFTQLWRNNGDGTFSNIDVGLPVGSMASMAWGDYNNDGWLDILLSGLSSEGNYITQVWRNNGDNTFSNINAGLPAVRFSSVAWGDYDNDGWLDILVAGSDTNGNPINQIWRNNGDNTFSNINAGLPAVHQGSVAWGDYDNDGRLDILLTGTTDGFGHDVASPLWRNVGPRTNTPPTAPANLTAVVTGRSVRLKWSGAYDLETPVSGLSYNIRVGTAPGAANVVMPPADLATGRLRVPAHGTFQGMSGGLVNKLPYGTYYWSVQAIDTAFAGSPFSEEGRFVIYLPLVDAVAATPLSSTAATFHGMANPMEHASTAWFEYGLSIHYGSTTASTDVGAGTNAVAFDVSAANLLPWMTYHYRAIASNCVGVAVGPDMTITLPGPSVIPPSLAGLGALGDITLTQGGSTSVWFTASPAGLDVRTYCSNPVLLPGSGLVLGGAGTDRSLGIIPDPSHSGSAIVTLTASDGSQTARQTINVTVTPSVAGYPSALLCLTNAGVVSTQAWRFQLVDAGTGSTNYEIDYRPDLTATSGWMQATNVTALGNGLFEVAIGPPNRSLGFYRAKGFRLVMGGFSTNSVTVAEGAGTAGPVLVFNGIYTGWVTNIWTDQQGNNITNAVWVNGTTAVIPVPPSYVADNGTIGPLQYLTLQLQAGPGFALGGTTRSTVTIAQNDSAWQGVLQTPGGVVDFSLTLLQTNGNVWGQIQSDGFGFFPTDALVQLNYTENAFTAVATNIPLPTLTAYQPLGSTNYMDLRLDATNNPGVFSVTSTQIQGLATLVSKAPGRSHLDAGVAGSFILSKMPTPASTNRVQLYTTNGVPIH